MNSREEEDWGLGDHLQGEEVVDVPPLLVQAACGGVLSAAG